MLEQRIEELTAAVRANTEMIERLASIMGRVPFRAPEPVNSFTSEYVEQLIDAGLAKKDEVPNEKPKSPPTSSTFDDSLSESEPVTYDQVKAIVIAISKTDKTKAVACLSRFGVKTAKDLAENQWASFLTYAQKVQNGELDPEAAHE